jgi:hypothetical protein
MDACPAFFYITLSSLVLITGIFSCNYYANETAEASPIFSRKVAVDDHPDIVDKIRNIDGSKLPNKLINYIDPDYGLNIGYPDSWRIAQRDEIVQFLTSGGNSVRTSIGFYSPPENESDTFQEHFLVNVFDNSRSIDEINDELRLKPDLRIVGYRPATIAGNPTIKEYSYFDNLSRHEIRETVISAVHDEHTYIFTFFAKDDASYYYYFPTLNAIVNSIKFIPVVPDIRTITYLSDGKTLDSTFWLNTPFNLPPSERAIFGMLIDIDLDQLPDYQVEMVRSGNGTWSKTVSEFEPTSTLPSQPQKRSMVSNQSSIYPNGKKYINLSADLSSLGFPREYKVLFYCIEIEDKNITSDLTNWINIPTPEFAISVSQNSISMRPGENATIFITANSSSDFKSTVQLSISKDFSSYASLGSNKFKFLASGTVI